MTFPRAISFAIIALVSSLPCAGVDRAAAVPTATRALVDATHGTARVSLHRSTGAARFVRFLPGSLDLNGSDPAERSADFLQRHGQAFGISDATWELTPPSIRVDRYGATRVSYTQLYRGLPVFAATLRTHFDAQGRLTAANGTFLPEIDLDPRPTHGADEAIAIATGDLSSRVAAAAPPMQRPSARLAIFREGLLRGLPGRDRLVWQVELGNGHDVRETLFVDAQTGKIVNRIDGIHRLNRQIHQGLQDSTILWSEGDPLPYTGSGGSDNPQINGLIDYAEDTYDLFSILSGGAHLSWDGADGTMHSVYKSSLLDCPNAAWTGSSTLFCKGVTADDVVAHEWTHGYTQVTHGLVMQWQSGALNESYSDIFGELVDLINAAGTDTPDLVRPVGSCAASSVRWRTAEDASAYGGANRDLWNPGCFGDPDRVSDADYHCDSSDSGGIHTNSGVPNHAFALLSDGGTFNGQSVTGIGLTKAAHIYWRSMDVYQVPSTDFADHADALAQSCLDLIGVNVDDLLSGLPSGQIVGAADCDELHDALQAVEMADDPPCAFDPLLAPGAPALACGAVAFFEDLERDPAGSWTFSNSGVFAEYTPRDWSWTSGLPGGVAGSALFGLDSPMLGNCIPGDDDQSGVMRVETPPIPLGGEAVAAFDHWVATEPEWDGGNVRISVNGGAYQLIAASRFLFNPYSGTLATAGNGNTNPLAGQAAFSGSDEGQAGGSWGQSQIDLSPFADAGDTIRLRFDLGVDGCNGLFGWYVDNLRVCTSENGAGRVPDGASVGGTPLTMGKSGPDVSLSWGASCVASDSDYEVYEGTLTDFSSHVSRTCSTGGATAWTLTPAAGSRYYLVVPRSVDREGSYGVDGAGAARAAAGLPCLPQALAPACE